MYVCVASVVHSNVAEQIGHGFSIVDASDRLSQDHTDVHGFDFWTLKLLDLMGNSVGHHHLKAQCTPFIAVFHTGTQVFLNHNLTFSII